jgi:hypothetical protein
MRGMHQLSPAARALLRALHEQPDEVPSTPREPLRELTRAGLVAYVDGLPMLTARGVNAATESAK